MKEGYWTVTQRNSAFHGCCLSMTRSVVKSFNVSVSKVGVVVVTTPLTAVCGGGGEFDHPAFGPPATLSGQKLHHSSWVCP